ncbi:expressed unknown protein [Seminavis robusta]|uniref:Uncharacterized protein n=1 Tax=Seminavis robusta TaxID=568900 RepID=A0A9N8DC17_9STRA|nr:expressed unknown protein [Seminavis robusta]|eukprot:Sro12_g009140.1 n/a (271) ;mRNA; f:24381-25193
MMMYDKPEGTDGTIEHSLVDIAIASPDEDESNAAQDSSKSARVAAKRILTVVLALALVIASVTTIAVIRQNQSDDNTNKQVSSTSKAQNNDMDDEFVTPEGCPREIKICSDLSIVTRTGSNCEFTPCPKGTCFMDMKRCADGTKVARDPENNCDFLTCRRSIPDLNEEVPEQPEETTTEKEDPTVQCPSRDIKMCTDLTTVVRTGPDCNFAACPPGSCLADSKECSDGVVVGRDPENDCEFFPCPKEVEEETSQKVKQAVTETQQDTKEP